MKRGKTAPHHKKRQRIVNSLHTFAAHAAMIFSASALVLSFGLVANHALFAINIQMPREGQETPVQKQNTEIAEQRIRLSASVFEKNQGQFAKSVLYAWRSNSASAQFDAKGMAVLSAGIRQDFYPRPKNIQITPAEKVDSKTNYLLGNDTKQWKQGIENYKKISIEGAFPGIVTEFSATQNSIEEIFRIQPGADPDDIQFILSGTKGMSIHEDGRLMVKTKIGDMVWEKPRAFQVIEGQQVPVDVQFEISQKKKLYGFKVGEYDAKYELVIDPTLVLDWSTYIGGPGSELMAQAEGTVDSSGNVLIAGSIDNASFPVLNAYQSTYAGVRDVWLNKYSSTGQLIFSTFLGGTGNDTAGGVLVDSTGAIYVPGTTTSTDFPIASAYQGTHAGGTRDYFLTKLNAAGSAIVFSTFIGGSGDDSQQSAAIDASGNIYVGGVTTSTNFPTLNPVQAALNSGSQDLTVTKFSSSGTFLFGTYFGGSGTEFTTTAPYGVDSSENVFIVGTTTNSTDFPTVNAYQPTKLGTTDTVFAKIKTTAPTSTVYSSYLGVSGSSTTLGDAAVDSFGNFLLAGITPSASFGLTSGAFQTAYGGGSFDAFVTVFSPTGTLSYATYIGGTGAESAPHMAFMSDGTLAVSLLSDAAAGLPSTSGGFQANISGGRDPYLMIFNQQKTAARVATFLGGTGNEVLRSMVSRNDTLYLAGTVPTADFPVANAAQGTSGGASDGFLSAIRFVADAPSTSKFRDLDSPYITALNPTQGTHEVDLRAPITVTFNEPMKATSFTSETVEVSQNGRIIPGTIEVSGTQMQFTPTELYQPNTPTIVAITTGVQDLAGNAYSYTAGIPDTSFAFSFKTRAATEQEKKELQAQQEAHEAEEAKSTNIVTKAIGSFAQFIQYILRYLGI